MSYLLRVDCSPRLTNSHSRSIADLIENRITALNPEINVKHRDLACFDIPHISNETINSFYMPENEMTIPLMAASALSDELIQELKGAETIIISAPMYNFGVPSNLKAWIDQVVRINHTFSYDGASFKGLVPVKKVTFALAYGAQGYGHDGDFSMMNFLEPYLVSLMSFLGIEATDVFSIDGTTGDPAALENQKRELISLINRTYV